MGIVSALCVLVSAYPVYAASVTMLVFNDADSPDVIITEFQTNGGTASQEFIELYNTTDKDIDLASGWRLQFFNSTSVKTGTPEWNTNPTASNSIALGGTIPAEDYFLLGSTDYKPAGVEPDQYYSPSSSHLMTDTGGGLQLLSQTGTTSEYTVYDRVMWLDAKANPQLPTDVLPRPAAGKSQQRVPDENDGYVAQEGEILPFAVEADATPRTPYREPQPEPEPETPVITEAETTDPQDPAVEVVTESTDTSQTPVEATDASNSLLPPQITELLPNPGSPLTDAKDEFIELYNPNDSALDLAGYEIEVGTSTLHAYTIPADTVIDAHGYATFYASQTNLALANNGGQARLKDSENKIVSETAAYTEAEDNRAWINNNGIWEWSVSATPGLANVLTAPAAATASSAAAKNNSKTATKAATTKKAAPKKSTAKAAKKAKASTTKKAKKAKADKKSKKSQSAATTTGESKPKPPIHAGILVAVGVVALLYGLYEYRHDISNKFAQLREHRAHRRVGGVQAAWRRGYSPN
jgi:hypothetical protein